MTSHLSADCLADVRYMLETREGITGGAADHAIETIDQAVDLYRCASGTLHADAFLRHKLATVHKRATALDEYCDVVSFPAEFFEGDDGQALEFRRSLETLQRILPRTKAAARALLSRCSSKRGRHADDDRGRFERDIVAALATANVHLTRGAAGTLAEILERLYKEIGLGDVSAAHAVRRALSPPDPEAQ